MPHLTMLREVRKNSWICYFVQICTKVNGVYSWVETHIPYRFQSEQTNQLTNLLTDMGKGTTFLLEVKKKKKKDNS